MPTVWLAVSSWDVIMSRSTDPRAGTGQARLGATSERVEGKVWADWEARCRTAPSGGEETHRGDSVPQENQPATQGKTVTSSTNQSSQFNLLNIPFRKSNYIVSSSRTHCRWLNM